MPQLSPSRRAVVGSALWSVPAVVVAASAPAFAGSTGSPQLTWGANPVVPSPDVPLVWDLHFVGAQITAPATLAAAASVVMTITFQPGPGSQYLNPTVYTFPAPAGWTSNRAPDREEPSVTLTSVAQLGAGQSLTLDGVFAGTAADNQFGTFTVGVTIGATSASFMINTPSAFPV